MCLCTDDDVVSEVGACLNYAGHVLAITGGKKVCGYKKENGFILQVN